MCNRNIIYWVNFGFCFRISTLLFEVGVKIFPSTMNASYQLTKANHHVVVVVTRFFSEVNVICSNKVF